MPITLTQQLDKAGPNDLPDRFRQVEIGQIIAGLIPTTIDRLGLVSQTTHVEPEPGIILLVQQPAATSAVIVGPGVTPGAGEVQVVYDENAVATLEFPAAVDTYLVVKTTLPVGKTINGEAADGLGELLAGDIG